jgi:hypothetical protein
VKLFVVLGALDVVMGLMVLSPGSLSGRAYLLGAGWCLVKGVWSILASAAVGYMYDWMGWLDVSVGVALWLISWGVYGWAFSVLGVLILLKGLYTLVRCL